MLFFKLFLLRIKWESDKFCKEIDRTAFGKALKQNNLPLQQYKNFLIQLYYYIQPGPDLLSWATQRMEKAGDARFAGYLNEHFMIEKGIIPLIVDDLKAIGTSAEEIRQVGANKETARINSYVDKLFHEPDPALIMVSDIAAKILLGYYTEKIIEAVRPNLPDPNKGISFLSKDTKAQIDIKAEMIAILKGKTSFPNRRRFLFELRNIFHMFKEWIEAL